MNMQRVKNYISAGKDWGIKHAPEILLAGGIVTLSGAIIFAVKGGINTPDIMEDHKERVRDVKIRQAREKNPDKKEVVKEYARTVGKLAIEYAPTVTLTGLSVTCFCASYGILNKRYVALGAAYTALQQSFDMYRQRVIEDHGKEKDLYYMTGQKFQTVTTTDEEGNKTKQKVLIDLPDGSLASPYAFKFGKYKENGDTNKQWENNQAFNLSYVAGQIDYLTDQLYYRSIFDDNHYVIKRGVVMLNELRDLLGEDPTTAGSIVGNRFGNPEPGCDGRINPVIINCMEKDPSTGEEIPCLWIDPNVDGLIFDKIDEWEEEPFYPEYRDNILQIIDENNRYEEELNND